MMYTAEAMGRVIRSERELGHPELSQAQLGTSAGYGKGAGVAISRIESGLTNPGEQRLAGIARALDMTPEQLKDAAEAKTELIARQRGQQAPKGPKEQLRATTARHAVLQAKIEARSKLAQDLGEAFNEVHALSRDGFFMKFVRVAESIAAAPEPTLPKGTETSAGPDGTADDAAMRVEAMSAGIANAILGGAKGAAAGAAAGGAAAYGAFTAAAMFGSASTGAAISTLTGVAATNATMAFLGGGTLAAGGAGMAGGALLLTGMVAAPVALLAAGGFYIVKRRRSKKEEERLSGQLDAAEKAMEASQAGFDAIVDVLPRATEVMEYVSVHGVHALNKWIDQLPQKPREWNELSDDNQTQYEALLTVSACLLSISSINASALLTSNENALQEMVLAVNETITYADRTIQALV